MNAFEQRLADRFREHGDRLYAELPDWPNTTITVGDGELRVVAERLNPGPRLPKIFRHSVHVPLEGLVRVQELVGRETIGDAVLVDARLVADRATDGPVLAIRGLRHLFDQIGRVSWLHMTSPMGVPLLGGWTNWENAEKRCIADIRRWQRYWVAQFEDLDFGLGTLLLDPSVEWDGTAPTHANFASGYTRLMCDGRFSDVEFHRCEDKRWLISRGGKLKDFVRRYQDGEIVEEGDAVDEDDQFLTGVFG